MCSSTGSRSFRASSGSRSARSSIEPFRSAKRTVTCLRSPSSAAREVRIFSARCRGVYAAGEANGATLGSPGRPGASDSPHFRQNFAVSRLASPQPAHPTSSRTPHSSQKTASAGLSCWHRGHGIPSQGSPVIEPGQRFGATIRPGPWTRRPTHGGTGTMARLPMDPVLERFHPAVRAWFTRRFPGPTEPQRHGWPAIAAGQHTLITAPTGSGKTLAAFLWALDALVQEATAGRLTDQIHVVYVSPLKALNNDIHRNLAEPLAGIREAARELGIELPELRAAVRTGDTPAPDRVAMGRRPPHILITTPESLFILLASERMRRALETVRTVIVDEVHAVAGTKRGVHLAVTLERLADLAAAPPVRIGLSATVEPVGEIAELLTGLETPGGPARPCRVVDVGRRRALDLQVVAPTRDLGAIATNAVWDATYAQLAGIIQQHRTTLVFANSRRLAERLAVRLTERLGPDTVTAHHGSLSRKRRLEAEARLKAGEIRAIVATGSLELGIDVGAIECVCQVESPRAVATAVQRVGRSGHWLGATPRGRLFALTRDDVLECAALVREIRAGRLDRVEIPQRPLDVLAQQVVAACADAEWETDRLFDLVRHTPPYRDLDRAAFDGVLR